jgi:hypothetical protein
LKVHGRTGIVTRVHRLHVEVEKGTAAADGDSPKAVMEENFLLLPCPWRVDFDWSNTALAAHLRNKPFVWDEAETKLPLLDLKVIPLGGGVLPHGGLCVMSREVQWSLTNGDNP